MCYYQLIHKNTEEVLHMIGSGLKKLAKENGMKVAQGVAYGSLRGYAATLSEGSGWKQIVFSTRFSDVLKKTELMELIRSTDVQKLYRVQNLAVAERSVQVTFLDNPGTMKKMGEFLDWFIPLLGAYGAAGANSCNECGGDVAGGRWVLINGIAYHMHDSCAQKVAQEIDAGNAQRKEEAQGSYITGLIGALLGAAVGAVVWALVLLAGYVASIVGLLIGWLAEKGYTLLKGKQGKGKVVILILAIILGVILGTFASDAITLAGMINDGELPGWTMAEIPACIYLMFTGNAEYQSATISNIGMGLLFAALGVFALLRNTGKAVADTKVKYLE